MRFRILLLVSLSLALSTGSGAIILGPQQAAAESSGASIAPATRLFAADALRARFASSPPTGIGRGTFALLERFYAARDYAPFWTDGSGFNPAGEALLGRLRRIAPARQQPLSPALIAVTSQAPSRGDGPPTEFELLLSAALIGTAIDPDDPAAIGDQPSALVAVANAETPLATLQELLPIDPAFWRLREAIQTYRRIEAGGGWPRVPPGPRLELGVQEPRVALLRQRLMAGGDLMEIGIQPESFDSAVDAALRRFQSRHGLQVDGVAGAKTLAALNTPVAERLAAMEINLRRIQQQRREWGDRYLAVNTAAASYRLVDRGHQVFERAAIVGRRGWATPQLESMIDRLEFNPYWVVPPRIARLEVLPKIRRNPDYLLRNDMHWVNGQIRQNPGPKNPLGKVKFLFLNPYSVYLHDTNSPQLFDRWDRFLSHGCMRIADALDLAAYLLKDDPVWPPQRIQEVVASGQTVQVRLSEPIPLHVIYDTAWVDDAGVVNFRSDVYGRDGPAGTPLAAARSEDRRCAA